ncbi:MAG: hypothetical protein FWH43_06920 [Endomicrobia bacterium]|nr:hypothetical protein [Endomicrobiia bacterium]
MQRGRIKTKDIALHLRILVLYKKCGVKRQKVRRWNVGKVGKDKDNDKEETTTAPLNFSASHHLIFQKGDVINEA